MEQGRRLWWSFSDPNPFGKGANFYKNSLGNLSGSGNSTPGGTDGLRDGDSCMPQPGILGAAGMAAAGWQEWKLLI